MARKRNKSFIPIPVASLAMQNWHIAHRFPGSSYQRNRGCGIWISALQPREVSPVYRVRVQYQLKGLPKVRVLTPELEPNAPHLYRDGTLCLYWPMEWEWRTDQLIAETILPWAASWLFYYELWLDSGKWLGPSSHDIAPNK